MRIREQELHEDRELHDLHPSPDTPILRTIKSRTEWVWVVACGTNGGEKNWLQVGGETRGKEEKL
jgi:hypothetical protein